MARNRIRPHRSSMVDKEIVTVSKDSHATALIRQPLWMSLFRVVDLGGFSTRKYLTVHDEVARVPTFSVKISPKMPMSPFIWSFSAENISHWLNMAAKDLLLDLLFHHAYKVLGEILIVV